MKIIANPNAGHGRGRAAIELLIRVLRRRDCDFDLRLTEAPLHATELAAELIRGGTGRIVVMGGDGTIGEVAKAVVGRDVEVGIISIGTGNDLARSLGLPRNDIEAAVSILDRGRVREIDLGRERDRTFVLMAGIGYPALVAEETNRMRRIKGPISYFAAVYKALARMRPFQAELVLDRQRLQLDCTSILVLNTPFCGGGQWMAPGASLEDGVLDVVVIGPVGRVDLMLNFPRVYRGTHISHPAFSVYRGARVEVRTRPPQGKMFDGDVAGETPLIAETIPKALKVVVAGE